MKRSTFFGRLGVMDGMSFSISNYASVANKESRNTDRLFAKRSTDKGFKPIISKTPWNQKVIYDKYTFVEMHMWKWIKQGYDRGKIEALQKELNRKIENNEIEFTKGPAKLIDGLWQLVLDGQQNAFLIETESGN